jgi:rhodanese-related sulfurtransferase
MNTTEQSTAPGGRGPANDIKVVGILATVALCAGLGINQFRDKPLPLVYQSKNERLEQAVSNVAQAQAPTQKAEVPAAIRTIDLAEFAELSKSGSNIILDARPEIFHRLGHIPKAIALPRDEFDTYFEKQRPLLEEKKQGVLLVYCSGAACEDSNLVAKALQKLGFSNIAIFKGGWSEWQKNSLPEEAS